MNNPGEQFSRVLIDKELEYSGWNLLDQLQVRFELRGEAGRADYVLFGSTGPLCVVEAKNSGKDPYEAKEQARAYASELKALFVVLSNGEAHWFWNLAKADEQAIFSFSLSFEGGRLIAENYKKCFLSDCLSRTIDEFSHRQHLNLPSQG